MKPRKNGGLRAVAFSEEQRFSNVLLPPFAVMLETGPMTKGGKL